MAPKVIRADDKQLSREAATLLRRRFPHVASERLVLQLLAGIKPHQADCVDFLAGVFCGDRSGAGERSAPGGGSVSAADVRGAVVGHVMGLGKTRTALTFLALLNVALVFDKNSSGRVSRPVFDHELCRRLSESRLSDRALRVLVLCPKTVVPHWAAEAMRWGGLQEASQRVERGPGDLLSRLYTLEAFHGIRSESAETCAGGAESVLVERFFATGGVFLLSFEQHAGLLARLSDVQPSAAVLADLRQFRRRAGTTRVSTSIGGSLCFSRVSSAYGSEFPTGGSGDVPHIADCLRHVDVVVLDEAHRFRNKRAKSVKHIEAAIALIPRRIALTGTPLQNHLEQYFTLLSLVRPDVAFADTRALVDLIREGESADLGSPAYVRMQRAVLEVRSILDPIVHRRGVEVQEAYLKPRHEFVVFLTLSPDQEKLYRQLITEANAERVARRRRNEARGDIATVLTFRHVATRALLHPALCDMPKMRPGMSRNKEVVDGSSSSSSSCSNDEDEQDRNAALPPGDAFRRRLMSGLAQSSKLSFCIDLLRRILRGNGGQDKVVVFSHYIDCLRCCEMAIRIHLQVHTATLTGATPLEERKRLIDEFNSASSGVRVLLCSSRAGGVGVSLIGANHCVLLDTSWNPTDDAQATFRCYRLGQQKEVFVYRLVAAQTLEHLVFFYALKKEWMHRKIVDKRDPVRSISIDVARFLRYPVDAGYGSEAAEQQQLLARSGVSADARRVSRIDVFAAFCNQHIPPLSATAVGNAFGAWGGKGRPASVSAAAAAAASSSDDGESPVEAQRRLLRHVEMIVRHSFLLRDDFDAQAVEFQKSLHHAERVRQLATPAPPASKPSFTSVRHNASGAPTVQSVELPSRVAAALVKRSAGDGDGDCLRVCNVERPLLLQLDRTAKSLREGFGGAKTARARQLEGLLIAQCSVYGLPQLGVAGVRGDPEVSRITGDKLAQSLFLLYAAGAKSAAAALARPPLAEIAAVIQCRLRSQQTSHIDILTAFVEAPTALLTSLSTVDRAHLLTELGVRRAWVGGLIERGYGALTSSDAAISTFLSNPSAQKLFADAGLAPDAAVLRARFIDALGMLWPVADPACRRAPQTDRATPYWLESYPFVDLRAGELEPPRDTSQPSGVYTWRFVAREVLRMAPITNAAPGMVPFLCKKCARRDTIPIRTLRCRNCTFSIEGAAACSPGFAATLTMLKVALNYTRLMKDPSLPRWTSETLWCDPGALKRLQDTHPSFPRLGLQTDLRAKLCPIDVSDPTQRKAFATLRENFAEALLEYGAACVVEQLEDDLLQRLMLQSGCQSATDVFMALVTNSALFWARRVRRGLGEEVAHSLGFAQPSNPLLPHAILRFGLHAAVREVASQSRLPRDGAEASTAERSSVAGGLVALARLCVANKRFIDQTHRSREEGIDAPAKIEAESPPAFTVDPSSLTNSEDSTPRLQTRTPRVSAPHSVFSLLDGFESSDEEAGDVNGSVSTSGHTSPPSAGNDPPAHVRPKSSTPALCAFELAMHLRERETQSEAEEASQPDAQGGADAPCASAPFMTGGVPLHNSALHRTPTSAPAAHPPGLRVHGQEPQPGSTHATPLSETPSAAGEHHQRIGEHGQGVDSEGDGDGTSVSDWAGDVPPSGSSSSSRSCAVVADDDVRLVRHDSADEPPRHSTRGDRGQRCRSESWSTSTDRGRSSCDSGARGTSTSTASGGPTTVVCRAHGKLREVSEMGFQPDLGWFCRLEAPCIDAGHPALKDRRSGELRRAERHEASRDSRVPLATSWSSSSSSLPSPFSSAARFGGGARRAMERRAGRKRRGPVPRPVFAISRGGCVAPALPSSPPRGSAPLHWPIAPLPHRAVATAPALTPDGLQVGISSSYDTTAATAWWQRAAEVCGVVEWSPGKRLRDEDIVEELVGYLVSHTAEVLLAAGGGA